MEKNNKQLPPSDAETDRLLIRLLRKELGQEWKLAKERVLAGLPVNTDPVLLTKFVDASDNPGIHINAFGIEPRFYAHRSSKRLLEFYPSQKSSWRN